MSYFAPCYPCAPKVRIMHPHVPKVIKLCPSCISEVWLKGFETGDYSEWDLVDGPPVIDSVIVHDGLYSSRSESDAFYDYYCQVNSPTIIGKVYCLSCWYRNDLMVLPADSWDMILGFQYETGSPYAAYYGMFFCIHRVNGNYYLSLNYRPAGIDYFDDTDILLIQKKWYFVELNMFVHATNGWINLYIDGIKKAEAKDIDTTYLDNITAGSSCAVGGTGLGQRKSWVDTVRMRSD